MTTEELNALVERLEAEGEYTGQPHELACRAAASAIRQLMSEREEAREVLYPFINGGVPIAPLTRDEMQYVRAARDFLSKHQPPSEPNRP